MTTGNHRFDPTVLFVAGDKRVNGMPSAAPRASHTWYRMKGCVVVAAAVVVVVVVEV